jgi:acyl-ACP thioesterase
MKKSNCLTYLIGLSDTDSLDNARLSVILGICNNLEYYQLLQESYYKDSIINKELVTVISYRFIEIIKLPKLNDTITIETFPYDVSKTLGYRHTIVYDENHLEIIKLYSEGPLYNLKTQSITRYNVNEIKVLNSYSAQDVKALFTQLPKDLNYEYLDVVKVSEEQLDRYNHVSNVRYVSIIEKYLKKYYNYLEVTYKRQARLGDELIIESAKFEGHEVIRLSRDGEVICFAIKGSKL